MAAGLPVVANPVGINRRMVVHGRTGLLACSPAEWAEAIARLAADPPLRREMGAAGRRFVQRRYAAARWAPKFAAVVDAAARRGPGTAQATRIPAGWAVGPQEWLAGQGPSPVSCPAEGPLKTT
jgi:hypothetical protein